MPPFTLTLARALEERMRSSPGIAGLDPASRLVTVGPGGAIHGVRLVPGEGAASAGLTLELVGLAGARLPEAAQTARMAALATCADAGRPVGEVGVRLTDVAEAPLPLQVSPPPPPPPERPPSPPERPPPPPERPPPPPERPPPPPERPPPPPERPPPPPERPPPPPERPPPPPVPTARPGQPVRLEVPGPDGTTIRLEISIQVVPG